MLEVNHPIPSSAKDTVLCSGETRKAFDIWMEGAEMIDLEVDETMAKDISEIV
jgi:hypothetical protein